ncbi:MAG: nitroreductase family protein [Nitrososphaerota archaeon]|nr:nitroreductase family protein [Candidatus Bathyarchaeota archaeon]MDW8049103.1 nitroreductase family protein [Nitrososphaerota archaeon]
MDFFDVVKRRRSIRAFTEKIPPEEDVMKLIEAARCAPSAGNIQPWEFIVVRRPEIKRRLCEAALGQSFVEEAPVVIVVCANVDWSRRGYGIRGAELYCLQDTAAATQNILLAAEASGLGACWVGAFNEDKVREVLKVPHGLRPVALIPIGYPAETPRPPYKRPLEEIVHYETF